MKILFIHGDKRQPGEAGGAESLLRDQAEGLKRLGNECAWWFGYGTIEEAISNFKPDVCHVMTTHCYSMRMEPVVYLQDRKIPHIIHVQDYWPFCASRMMMIGDKSCSAVCGTCQSECGQKANPDYLRICNRSFIVAGNANTAEIYRRNGLRCDAVVELGVDTDLFCPGEPHKEPEIITSCSILAGRWKGMHIIERAIKDTPYKVKLLTGLSREQVAAELKNASIFIFPSLYEETFGLSLCEAMATGLACISTDNAGGLAQIEHGVNGLIVEKGNSEKLRKAIELLIESPELRLKIGFEARKHVLENHTLEAMAKRFIGAYNMVINGRMDNEN